MCLYVFMCVCIYKFLYICMCVYVYVHVLMRVYMCMYISMCMYINISSCYGSISLTSELIGRDGGLSTLCHSCGFACQQRVVKRFPGPGYLHSEDGVV